MKIDRFNIGSPIRDAIVRRPHPDNYAVDAEGRLLPYSPEQVAAMTHRALDEGTVLAAVLMMPSGDLAVQVLGPPSIATCEILEQAARSYRAMFAKKNVS